MSKKSRNKNRITDNGDNLIHKLKSDLNIGSPDAETDHHLTDVFVDNGALDALTNITSPKCIIVGRTGTGKSALIKKVKEIESYTQIIEPERMALTFLSNSTILEYLRSENVNLNFFYKLLWKHVFVVEIIKLYISESDTKKSSFFQKLWESVTTGGKSDEAKKRAIDYAKTWSDEFWLTTEYRIRSIESQLENKIANELGIEIKAVKLGTTNSINSNEKTTIDVKTKAENIISQLQANDLTTLIELLGDKIFNSTQRKFFILIDDLDKEWVSRQIVYDLIASMIEVIKEFQQRFKGVKLVISLRENLQMKVFSGTSHRGGQREKFTPLFLDLNWQHEDLKKLIDLRIHYSTGNKLSLDSLFEKSLASKVALEYIVTRTFLRPRDIIAYFNRIFSINSNRNQVSMAILKEAEVKYSIERLNAVEDEWIENYGEITKITTFLNNMHDGFNIRNVKEDSFAELMIESDYVNYFKGELYSICHKWINSKGDQNNFKTFLSEVFEILYRIGIIGIKRSSTMPIEFYYNEASPCTRQDFMRDIKIYVHKAFHSVFRINNKTTG